MPLRSSRDDYADTEPTREEYDMQEEQRAEWEATRELIVATPIETKPTTIVRAAIGDVTDAIVEYTRIKDALDKALPDCIQMIQGKQFRKKNYWRAIATAFNLSLELREEKLDDTGSGWGYLVTYRASAPNGRFADGDGSCYASEKKEAQATVHNVRAHAHTRAMNRAISNLVGFGEVSAEEMPHDDAGRGVAQGRVAPVHHSLGAGNEKPRPASSTPSNPDVISDAQRRRLWAIWSKRWESEVPDGSAEAKEANLKNLVSLAGYDSTKAITKKDYELICQAIERWQIPETAPADPSWDGGT